MNKTIEVTIGEKTWTVHKLRGMKAIRKMPKVLKFLSMLVNAAVKSGIPVDKWLQGQATEFAPTFIDIIGAIEFVSEALGEHFNEFERDVVPFLLDCDPKWLEDHGTPYEIFAALWQAILFHVETSLGTEVTDALKNSPTTEPTVEEEVAV